MYNQMAMCMLDSSANSQEQLKSLSQTGSILLTPYAQGLTFDVLKCQPRGALRSNPSVDKARDVRMRKSRQYLPFHR